MCAFLAWNPNKGPLFWNLHGCALTAPVHVMVFSGRMLMLETPGPPRSRPKESKSRRLGFDDVPIVPPHDRLVSLRLRVMSSECTRKVELGAPNEKDSQHTVWLWQTRCLTKFELKGGTIFGPRVRRKVDRPTYWKSG